MLIIIIRIVLHEKVFYNRKYQRQIFLNMYISMIDKFTKSVTNILYHLK